MKGILKLFKKHRKLIFAGLIFFALLLVLSDNSKKETKANPETPEERYFISSREKPSIREAIFKPLDFVPNEEQIVYVKLENQNPVEKVTATVSTDKKVQTYELKLFEGNDRVGTWRGSWRTNDTHNYTYTTTLTAISGSDKSSVDLSFPLGTKRIANTLESSSNLPKLTSIALLVLIFIVIETGTFKKIQSALTKSTRKD